MGCLVESLYGRKWEDEPDWFKHGTLIKKSYALKLAVNPLTGEEVQVILQHLTC